MCYWPVQAQPGSMQHWTIPRNMKSRREDLHAQELGMRNVDSVNIIIVCRELLKYLINYVSNWFLEINSLYAIEIYFRVLFKV